MWKTAGESGVRSPATVWSLSRHTSTNRDIVLPRPTGIVKGCQNCEVEYISHFQVHTAVSSPHVTFPEKDGNLKESAAWYHQEACGASGYRVHSLSPAGPRGDTNEVTHMDGDSSRCTGGVRSRPHQAAAGTGGSRKNDGMGMSRRRDGAWIDGNTSEWPAGASPCVGGVCGPEATS